jgi:hypothetical protein
MATGDSIDGAIRVVRQDAEGNILRVFGPIGQDRVDYFNNDLDAEEKLYLNTALSDRRSKPSGAESMQVPDMQWGPAEVLRVQHMADATVANDIDRDLSGAYEIDAVVTDLNRNVAFPETLRTPDNELESDPAEAKDSWVTFFEYTVGDRRRLNLAGRFGAAAVEN